MEDQKEVQPKFNPGDRVKAISQTHGNELFFEVGDTGTVVENEMEEYGMTVLVNWDNPNLTRSDGSGRWWCGERDLVLA